MVPVDAVLLIVTHTGKQYAAGLRLLDDVFDYLRAPVVILAVLQWISFYGNCPGGTEHGTAMATDAVLATAIHVVIIGIVVVGIEAALADTRPALNTAFGISLHNKSWW
jgi:hypothetical protein